MKFYAERVYIGNTTIIVFHKAGQLEIDIAGADISDIRTVSKDE